MANPNTTPTRPWMNLDALGLRVLHARDNQGRHMLMLAPLDYEESTSTSLERLESYRGNLAQAVRQFREEGLNGSLVREGRFAGHFAFTGPKLGSFRSMFEVIRTAFPEVQLAPETPAHFIRLTNYIQYRQQQRFEKARQSLDDRIAEMNAVMPSPYILEQYAATEDHPEYLTLENTEGMPNEVVAETSTVNLESAEELFQEAAAMAIQTVAYAPISEESLKWWHSLSQQDTRALGRYEAMRVTVQKDTLQSRIGKAQHALMTTLLLQDEDLADLDTDELAILHKKAYLLEDWDFPIENAQFSQGRPAGIERITHIIEEREAAQETPDNEETPASDGDTDRADNGGDAAVEGQPQQSLEDLKEMRDNLEEQLARQGQFVDARLQDRLDGLERTIAELEGAPQVGESWRGNGQDGETDNNWRWIGENADGLPVWEDARGIRATEPMEGIYSTESVGVAFTRHGIEAHVARRKDEYRTTDELAQRQAPSEPNEAQLIRAAFVAQEADLGEPVGVTVEYQGQSRQFLVVQKHPTPRDGHQLPTLNVQHLRNSTESNGQVIDDFLVTPRDTLDRRGLPRKATDNFKTKWAQAGLTVPVPAPPKEWAAPDELENPYNRSVTPLTYQDYTRQLEGTLKELEDAQSALRNAQQSGDIANIGRLSRIEDRLSWQRNDLLAGYMMTALGQDNRKPNQWPTNEDILPMAESYPALAQRLSEVTGTPIMAGPWPRVVGHFEEIQEKLKAALADDPDNPVLTERLMDVEADMELAANGIGRSGWGNGQYVNRDNPILGAQNRANLSAGQDEAGDEHATGTTDTDRAGSRPSDVESVDDSGSAAAGSGQAGEGAGGREAELGPRSDAGGSAGSDRATESGTGAGTNDLFGADDTADEAERHGSSNGADADRAGVSSGGDGAVRSGAAGGDDRGSADDAAALGTEPGESGDAGSAPTGGTTESGRSGDAGSVRADSGNTDGSTGEAATESARSDGGDRSAEPGADERDGAGDERSGRASGDDGNRVTGWRFEPGHDHAGKTRTQRVDDNLAALETLIEIESEQREPTPDERAILAEYSGWGGLPLQGQGMYGSNAPAYVQTATQTLTGMVRDEKLTSKDYTSILGSTLNAHYTHSGIIEPMWQAIERLGVPTKRILDPSTGTLNFKSYMPDHLAKEARFTGVELDPLTARIAQALHPDAHIHQTGYEDAPVRSNFYDVAISNVPFGEYNVFDRKHPKWNHSIHNYFLRKSIEDLRPGGVTAFVTSTHTMDAQDDTLRREMAEQAHFIGAVRLPAGAFSDNTQTDVQTDILFFQKKGDFEPSFTPKNFANTTYVSAPLVAGSAQEIDGETVEPGESVRLPMNQYFAEHPEHVLGDLAVTTGRFGATLTAKADLDIAGLKDKLAQTFETFPANITVPDPEMAEAESAESINEQQSLGRTGGHVDDPVPGALFYSEDTGDFRTVMVNGLGEAFVSEQPVKVAKNKVAKTRALIDIMTSARRLLVLQSEGDSPELEAGIAAERQQLNELYDDFEQRYGMVNTKENEKLFGSDPRAPFLYGLETTDRDTEEVRKSDVFHKRVVQPTIQAPTKADTPEDALAISLAYTGKVSMGYIKDLLDNGGQFDTNIDVRQHLLDRNLIYINPETELPETPEQYLSGNLRPKLDLARESAAVDPVYEQNVKALEEVWPAPLKPSQVKVGIDATWLPKDVIEEFVRDELDIPLTNSTGSARVDFDNINRHWRMDKNGSISMQEIARRNDQAAMHKWGTERAPVFRILDHAFTNTMPVIRDKISDKPKQYQVNTEETQKAEQKLEAVKEAFDRWVFRDSDRAQRITKIYNDQYNTTRVVDPNGDHMVYPGMAPNFIPRKHQNDFVWRAISGKNSLTAHVVGAGKTMQLVSTAIRGKQLGRWKNPMTVVPNHMLRQFAADAQKIYPSARILVIDKDDITPKKRAQFAAKAAMGDWDLVICTHATFGRIGVPPEFEVQMLEQEKENLEAALRENEENGGPRYTEREIQNKLKKLETKLKKLYHALETGRDDSFHLGQIGTDFIGLDEAHFYKNLALDAAQNIPGLSTSDSQRAFDVYMKCRYMKELHDGPYGVMMATGTPISNSITECYTFTRMLRPDLLEESGIRNFNDWVGLYGEVKFALETKPEGGGVHLKGRLSQFKNVPELVRMIRTFMDFKTQEDLNLPSPDVEHEVVVAQPTKQQQAFMKYVEARARGVRDGKKEEPSAATLLAQGIRGELYGANDKPKSGETASSKEQEQEEETDGKLPQEILLTISTDARKNALDQRLTHPGLPDDPNSKVNLCVNKCLELYERFAEDRATQMIFCDFSSPTGKGKFNVYDDIKAKLIAGGVDESEIAYIHDAKDDDAKEKLFEKVRTGEIRFLLGSTQKMGVGTNVQERLVAMHQLDPPWKPADLEQRLGRMARQGNQFGKTFNFQYVTQDSLDSFMWDTLNRKKHMIESAMTSPEEAARELDEDTKIGFEDIMAEVNGNPKFREFVEVRLEREKLQRKEASHLDEQADLGGRIATYKDQIKSYEADVAAAQAELEIIRENQPLHLEVEKGVAGLQDGPTSYIGGIKGLARALEDLAKEVRPYTSKEVGVFGGLTVQIDRMKDQPSVYFVRANGKRNYVGSAADDEQMALQEMTLDGDEEQKSPYHAIANKLAGKVRFMSRGDKVESLEAKKAQVERNLEQAEAMKGQPFEEADKLKELQERYEALAEELGDAVKEDKGMNPAELIPWMEAIKDLEGVNLRKAMGDMDPSLREELFGEEAVSTMGWDDMDDDEDESAGITLA